MDKLSLHTSDLTERNYKTLATLFPNAVTETINENGEVVRAIDADVLAQEINTHVVSGKEERYQFTWPDKKKAVLLANSPIAATLRPCREESVDFDKTENLYIEGDNLDVLKLLRETYLGRVKMIYIDPPYNTGNDFVYNDDFTMDSDEWSEISGDYDKDGNRMVKNLDSNGQFHTDWLNMMYPRLRVARDLLSDDGVIFISIDDGEVENMKKICNEVFGERNFQAQIAWRRRHNQPNDKSKMIAKVSENIIVYSKNATVLSDKRAYYGLPLSEDRIAGYTNPDNDPKGRWTSNPWKAATGRGGTNYTITTPNGIKYTETWYGNAETFSSLIEENRVYWTDGGNGLPRIKIYLSDAQREGQAAINFFTHERYGSNQEGSAEFESLFGKKGVFDNPKPTKLIKALAMLTTEKDSIILDFFSGSATTAHAVMQLNTEDAGNRKFIMVQLPETCDKDSEAAKAGYKNICEIGKERIRRAGQKIIAGKNNDSLPFDTGSSPLDIGFRVLKLDSSNMKDIYYKPQDTITESGELQLDLDGMVDNIKHDRTSEDLLFQVMLDLGILLSSKIEKREIGGKTVFIVDDNKLIACFEHITDETVTEIAKSKPYYAVFRDSNFGGDATLVNFEQIFKTYSPTTIRKVL